MQTDHQPKEQDHALASSTESPKLPSNLNTDNTTETQTTAPPLGTQQTRVDAAITGGMIILTLIISIIIFRQFKTRDQKRSPTQHTEHQETTPADDPQNAPQEPATGLATLDAPAHTAGPTDTTPQKANETPSLLPHSFQQADQFRELIAPLKLEPITPGNWLPVHLWRYFELTKDAPQGLTAFQFAAPPTFDYVLALGQYQSTPQKTNATTADSTGDTKSTAGSTSLKLVMILRSYRLSLAPDPINIYSHALETTAEGFHDTLLLYKTAKPNGLESYQQFLSDGLAIFESLANPSNEDARGDWLAD